MHIRTFSISETFSVFSPEPIWVRPCASILGWRHIRRQSTGFGRGGGREKNSHFSLLHAESGMKRRAASFPCHRLRRRFIPIFILFHFLSRSLKHDVTLRAPDHLFAIFKFFISTPICVLLFVISPLSLSRSLAACISERVCVFIIAFSSQHARFLSIKPERNIS
jgi:hypothetical protein